MFNATFETDSNFCAHFGHLDNEFGALLNRVLMVRPKYPDGGNTGDLLAQINSEEVGWLTPSGIVQNGDSAPVTSQAVYDAISELNRTINNLTQIFAQIRYDTEANWNFQLDMIAEQNVLYIYTDHFTILADNNTIYVPGIKIGDGTTYLIDLPFITDGVLQAFQDHVNNQDIHVSANDRVFWNNKVSCFLDNSEAENIIFSKNTFVLEE